MKNVGTLVGAPIRINDDQDLYPAAHQSEIKGGHHNRTTVAELATFPTHLKVAGMTCYIATDKTVYILDNDLITWTVNVSPTPAPGGAGGTVSPGTGGNTNDTATIISGNFGEWLPIPTQSASIFDKQIDLQYKADLAAFPNRAIVYLTGQFGLDAAFVGTSITLGTLPLNSRPKAQLKKWMACKAVEMYLVVETTGEVKLISKDGFNLPVATDVTEPNPYFIDIFFNPDIAVVIPTTHTFTRTANFYRDDCGSGYAGSVVSFSKDYTSTTSLADAQNIALADSNFDNLGQANANSNGSCTLAPLTPANVSLEVTAPASQTGANNVFGFKIVSDIALEEAITIDFKANYETSGGSFADYYGQLILPAGEVEFDPTGYPILASPAANAPTITILTVSPTNGSEVTEYGTINKLTLTV